MKISLFKKILLSTVFVITLSVPTATFAKDSYGFTQQQIKALKDLKMPIIFADWLPKGFKLEYVTINLVSPKFIGINSYSLIYRDNNGNEFEISSSAGGAGDKMIEPDTLVKTKVGEIGVFTKTKCITTDWIYYKNFNYEFYGCDSTFLSRNVDTNPISKDDALKIIKSMTVIK